jgi:hypothetical protein
MQDIVCVFTLNILEDDHEIELSEIARYQEILAASPSFEWLLSRIQSHHTLSQNPTHHIRVPILPATAHFAIFAAAAPAAAATPSPTPCAAVATVTAPAPPMAAL